MTLAHHASSDEQGYITFINVITCGKQIIVFIHAPTRGTDTCYECYEFSADPLTRAIAWTRGEQLGGLA